MKYSNLFADIFTWQSAYDSYEVLKRTRLYTCTCHFLPHKVYGSTQTNISGKNPEIWEILQQLQQIIYINDFFNSQVCHSFCPYSFIKNYFVSSNSKKWPENTFCCDNCSTLNSFEKIFLV